MSRSDVVTQGNKLVEKLVDLTGDLKLALREGWIAAADRSAHCNYCSADAEHDAKAHGYVCDHEPDCLMVKHADLVGDVNDPANS